MKIIKADNVVYEYIRRDEEGNVEGITKAVNDVSLDIEQGQFIAILGHNGSGKSTLAKHMNAILNPTEGTLWVDGMFASNIMTGGSVRVTESLPTLDSETSFFNCPYKVLAPEVANS